MIGAPSERLQEWWLSHLARPVRRCELRHPCRPPRTMGGAHLRYRLAGDHPPWV